MTATSTNLSQRVLFLERQVQALLRKVQGERVFHVNEHRQTFLAWTIDLGEYPEPCGTGTPVFPIRFLDVTFPQTAEWHLLTQAERSNPSGDEPDAYAANIAGEWVPPLTLVEVMWQRAVTKIAGSEDDGEWWFEYRRWEFVAEAELVNDLCGEETDIEVENGYLLPSGEEYDFSDIEIENPRKHRGQAGAKVLLVNRRSGAGSGSGSGSESAGSGSGGTNCGPWQIVDIEQRAVCLVHRIEDSDACVKFVTLRTAGEWAPGDEPNQWCQLFPWTDCPEEGSGSGSGDAEETCDLSFAFDVSWCCSVVGCDGSGSGGTCGYCTWVWEFDGETQTNVWNKLLDNCDPDCTCAAPTQDGTTLGETTTTYCREQ